MENKELTGKIARLESLKKRAEEEGKAGMVLYYQLMIEELLVKQHQKASLLVAV